MGRSKPRRRVRGPITGLAAGVRAGIERTAFWLAIALVAGYPGVLLAGRVVTVPTWALVGLLGGHLLTIAAGHRYDPSGDRRHHDGGTTDDAATDEGTTDDGVRPARMPADD
jgi:hypothetical protein